MLKRALMAAKIAGHFLPPLNRRLRLTILYSRHDD
jgi:hypothetical protein